MGAATAARAHEFWLAPSAYLPAPGDSVLVTAFVGTGFRGELKPYATTRVALLQLRGRDVVDLGPTARDGDPAFARVRLSDRGGALIAYQSTYAHLELPGVDFDSYLRTEGLDEIVAARARQGMHDQPGLERYRRCAKTWLAGSDPARARQVVGMPLELVPLDDPGRADPLTVQVLWEGKPLPGALLRAWRQPLQAKLERLAPMDVAGRDSVSATFAGRSDAQGRVAVPLERAGEWLLSTVHMVPSSERQSDWESSWASFTFARRDH